MTTPQADAISVQSLNGDFGAFIADVTRAQLADEAFRYAARNAWKARDGLLVLRGAELADMEPHELTDFAASFGALDKTVIAGREHCMVDGTPILRIGNVRNEAGELVASLARGRIVERDEDVRYDPATRRPVWHTDALFHAQPPIGSVFHCRQAPRRGGDTLFADTAAAFAALDADTQQHLAGVEAVCSLAHHDKKISLYSPDYPVLDAEQRRANPAQRVPVVLEHPDTGRAALYGLNSGTCAVVEKGASVSDADMDRYELEGEEDASVATIRDLLPFVTGPEFTVRWRWQPGDVVVWDNRCTLHAGTGFDHDTSTREMWRLTLHA